MNEQWRTTTVLALCRRMLDSRQFDALPILADALEDAGCCDERLLARCHEPEANPVLAERLVNLVYSDETATAVRWLEQFVREINYEEGHKEREDEWDVPSDDVYPHTYEFIIQAGRDGIKEGSMFFGSDAGADFFRQGDENRREFFRNWSLATGVPVPQETQDRIHVSCAC